jgi:hypothetical protein
MVTKKMSNEPLITIVIPQGKFEYLKSTLSNHKGFIHKLGVPELVKDSLIKDAQIIETIITSNTKKGV